MRQEATPPPRGMAGKMPSSCIPPALLPPPARQNAAPLEVEFTVGVRLQKTFPFSPVSGSQSASRAGRPRPGIPSASLPLFNVREAVFVVFNVGIPPVSFPLWTGGGARSPSSIRLPFVSLPSSIRRGATGRSHLPRGLKTSFRAASLECGRSALCCPSRASCRVRGRLRQSGGPRRGGACPRLPVPPSRGRNAASRLW